MEDNGFSVTVKELDSTEAQQAVNQVPPALQACHTAIVDGYLIEGHVPVKEITRLLAERPAGVIGLAVPGMPVGSPGMTVESRPSQPYDVLTFNKAGATTVYASYGK